jgi:two-component system phosphate regulon sensor histidine kinase PhoR
MTPRPLAWKLFPTFLAVILLCTFGMAVYAISSARTFYIDHAAASLQSQGRLVEHDLLSVDLADKETLQARVQTLGKAAGTRITVIDNEGVVLAESQPQVAPDTMWNHKDRPEIVAARQYGAGNDVRYSSTLKTDMVYGAVKGKDARGRTVFFRAATPMTEVDRAMRDIYMKIMLAGAVLAVLAAGIGVIVVLRIARPLRDIAQGARRMSAGEFGQKLRVPPVREFAALAESLNRMARQLDDKIRALTAQKNEQEAVLAGMIEGVVAVDLDERILSINRAAAEMIQAQSVNVIGKPLSEAMRNLALAKFVSQILGSDEAVEGEIVLNDGAGHERFVQARGTALLRAGGRKIGALLVLHDMTRLHLLETMRRDFVANVSHELKTPITSIKGFVETLREGALEDPASARKFLEIIARQADRLNQIIDDLLTLSRIEREAQDPHVVRERGNLNGALRAAVDDCQRLLKQRKVQIALQCPKDLELSMNAQLIEQAVVNLLDNAIKYSPPASSIELTARRQDEWVLVEVADRGCGIGPEHLGRIFERFYRVDKARSREQGGTGLGLAIVKHIAQAHGGKVSVQSTLGKGSTFTVWLPACEGPGEKPAGAV